MLTALLQNLATQGDAWHLAIMDDMEAMRLGLPQMAEMPQARADPQAWLDLVRTWPIAFKKLAKRLGEGTAGVDLALGGASLAAPCPGTSSSPATAESGAQAPTGVFVCEVCGAKKDTFHM